MEVGVALLAIDGHGGDTLGANEADKWDSYVYARPDTGGVTGKHTWVVRHDGLFFGAGWQERE